jgi:S-methylmethionine-dependent homocysteine/selenocysteine methylase
MEVTDTKPTSDPEANTRPSKPSLPALLSSGPPIILDGALATYLESLGADVSSALWSAQILASQPHLIYRTHLDYYRAGANVAITASYQAAIPGLTKGLEIDEKKAKKLVRESVDLANQARHDYLSSLDPSERPRKEGKLFVAGSVGPYGAYLADGSEYRGDYSLTPNAFKDFHRGRLQALVEAGVDVLACETIPSAKEAEALAELLHLEFPGTEAWFTFSLRDESHISDGTPLDRVVGMLDPYEQVVAIGVNCVPDTLIPGALKMLKASTRKALVVYPNSGESWNAEKRDWEGERNEGGELSKKSRQWSEAGAKLIGGCCRTTPSDIGVIASTLDRSGV